MARRPVLVAVALSSILAACQDQSLTQLPEPTRAPSTAQSQQGAPEPGSEIEGEYVVLFGAQVNDAANEARGLVSAHGGSLGHTYQSVLRGFSASLPDQAVEALASNPRIAYVGPNRVTGLVKTQHNATWGIDRIDQQTLPLNQTYSYKSDGSGVNIFIVDTGIRIGHNEFGNRASYLPGAANGDFAGDGQGTAEDCNGHGTHVAGTAAGSTYGVAKGADVWAVRVLDCTGAGTSAGLIAGVDAIVGALNAGDITGPASGNMSLSTGIFPDPAIDAAVAAAVAQGVNFAVAAGNGFLGFPFDACTTSPANTPSANTVGATMSNDNEAPFSNYGPCVDILAPGVDVTSAGIGSDDATAINSGTSMATPHVAGVTAIYLEDFPNATPADVSAALVDNAVLNTIIPHIFSETFGSTNAFLNMEFLGGGGGPPGNNPPTADFTPTVCATLTCDFTDASSDSDGSIASWAWDFGDGAVSALQNPSHTYAAQGVYPVTLTVTDDGGAPGQVTQSVTVSSAAVPPTASFTWTLTDLDVVFTDTSVGGDGTVVNWSWDFGDSNGSTAQNPIHSYASAGTYTVTLTITDDLGGMDSANGSVTVTDSSEPPEPLVLTAAKGKVKGEYVADLALAGGVGVIDVYLGENIVGEMLPNGTFRHFTGFKGRQSFTNIYHVCEADEPTVCSDEVIVSN